MSDGRLQSQCYPEGWRHIEDDEISVAGQSMCCINSDLDNPASWKLIDAHNALGITGKQLRQKWTNYTFAIKITVQPIFTGDRVLSSETITSLIKGEQTPPLSEEDEQLIAEDIWYAY